MVHIGITSVGRARPPAVRIPLSGQNPPSAGRDPSAGRWETPPRAGPVNLPQGRGSSPGLPPAEELRRDWGTGISEWDSKVPTTPVLPSGPPTVWWLSMRLPTWPSEAREPLPRCAGPGGERAGQAELAVPGRGALGAPRGRRLGAGVGVRPPPPGYSAASSLGLFRQSPPTGPGS